MDDPSPRRFAAVLDRLTVFLILAAYAIALTGGFFFQAGSIRISARSADRAAYAALALLLLRVARDRRTLPFGLTRQRFDELRTWSFDSSGDFVPHTRRAHAIAAAIGLCAAAIVLLYPQLRHMRSVPDPGDPLFSMWRMGWVYQQILGDPRPLFDTNIFHPDPLTLTYSDSMLLPSLAGAPLLALGIEPVLVYNILFVASFPLSAIAACALGTKLTGSRRAGFVAGLVFGFYPFRFEHYSHLELQFTFWLPLALLALHRFFETGRARYAAAAVLAVLAQLYSSMYFAVFFTIFVAAAGSVLVASLRRRLRPLLRPAALAVAGGIVLAWPLARPYIAAREYKGDRQRFEVEMYSAQATDYLRAHFRSVLYGPRLLPGRQTERALFPGVTPLALSAAALVPPLGAVRLAYLAGALAAFDGSLGFNGVLYNPLYALFVPIRGMRVPARFSMLVGLGLAVLSAFGARRLLTRYPGRRGTAVFALLIVAATLDAWSRLTLEPVRAEAPTIYSAVSGNRSIVLAEFPLSTNPGEMPNNIPYLYFSLWHWAEMVNGYSGLIPDTYAQLVMGLEGFPDAPTIRLLKDHGVTHVSVNCALYGEECHRLLDAIKATPGFRSVAEGRWQGKPVHLFELVR